jgi:hypothetical protein
MAAQARTLPQAVLQAQAEQTDLPALPLRVAQEQQAVRAELLTRADSSQLI